MKTINIQLVFIFIFLSCGSESNLTLRPTNNKGGYSISIAKNPGLHRSDSILIYGYVKDIEQNTALVSSFVKAGCIPVRAGTDGFYRLKEIATDKIYLTCSWIGYKSIETEFLKLTRGDSVRVDFFLAPDDRPLINCEGVINVD